MPPAAIARLPRRERRWLRFVQVARVLLVVGVAVGITAEIGGAVINGQPTFPDPLTTQQTFVVAPATFTYLAGWITGEDYINGNFTVVYPVGVPIDFAVYNSTEFSAFTGHRAAATIAGSPGQSAARILFSAPYTDTFYLVFANPYPPTSGITVHVYVVTNYQTNIVIG